VSTNTHKILVYLGFYVVVMAGAGATTYLSWLHSDPALRTVAEHLPAPHAGLGEASGHAWIVADPIERRRDPELWTVRTRYDSLIKAVAAEHGVDPALVKAMVQAESAFDPSAESRAGAQGLMQVLPETASRFAVEDLFDPGQNLEAGVLYLKHLIDLFDGNVTMAVAAYNAGPNRVRRYRGVPPYAETQSYLGKVMGLRHVYADQLRRS